MQVSGWKNGRFGTPNLMLGVRVGAKNVAQFFDKGWTEVVVELDGTSIIVPISHKFFGRCPELRSSAIGKWIKEHKLAPWKIGYPPKLKLLPLGTNRFRLLL